MHPEVRERYARALAEGLGNPASVHQAGRAARQRLMAARERVARVVGCEPKEVVFTASGSEADALALKGAPAGRVVISQIEHPALLDAAAQLERLGAAVVRVPPNRDGRIDAARMISELTPGTRLCSLLWVNNETGVVQPVREVARACRDRGVLFHSDAVQAAGKVPMGLREADADMLSLSAHKLGGPVGIGALIVRRGVALEPLVPGHQEDGRRGGTSSVAQAEALAFALEHSAAHLDERAARLGALRDRFERAVRDALADVEVNGLAAPRCPNTSNLQFTGADGEALLIALDLEGICVSTGAACASGSLKPSHVLLAMGRTPAQAQASLRFSLGPEATAEEVDQVVAALVRAVPHAREAAQQMA